MGIDPSNINNLPKMPKNVAPKNPNKPQNMPQPEGSIMKNLPKPEGQTGFEAVIQPKGEVTVEDKKSQQAHANANKANVDAVAMMKAAAQGGVAGVVTGEVGYSGAVDYSGTATGTGTADYTAKTADGIEYSRTINLTGQVNIEHTHENYENGKKVGEQKYSGTTSGTATGDVPYSGTPNVTGQVKIEHTHENYVNGKKVGEQKTE